MLAFTFAVFSNESSTISEIEPIKLESSVLDSLRSSDAFFYDDGIGEKKLTVVDLIWLKIKQWFQDIIEGIIDSGTGDIIGYLLVLLIIGFLIYQIAKGRTSSLVSLKIDEKLKHELVLKAKKEDFDRLINKAKSDKNLSEATRVYFLKSLSILNKTKNIKFSENKTNRDYYYEIKDQKIRKDFKNLVDIFDYTFYGEFEINTDQFNRIETLFTLFINSLEELKYEDK